MKEIKQKAYEKYQMHWMLSHDVKVTDFGKLADAWRIEREEDASKCVTFLDFLEEQGFDGCLWSCYEEFLECEYQDRGYMQFLLTEEKEWKDYLMDVGDGYVLYIEALSLVEDCVKKGVLQETESHIFIERTTGWYLEPKDMVAKGLMYDKEGRDTLTAALEACEAEEVDDDI